MTEEQKTKKSVIWEPFDEKETEELRKQNIKNIDFAKSVLERFRLKLSDPTTSRKTPSMRAHYAVFSLAQYYHIDMLERVNAFSDMFVNLVGALAVVLQSLDKQVQEISEKTGVDLSQMKNELAQVKETVNAPIYKFLKEQKEGEEKIRKMGEETFDYLTRSH